MGAFSQERSESLLGFGNGTGRHDPDGVKAVRARRFDKRGLEGGGI
jgi:hypothetical protein